MTAQLGEILLYKEEYFRIATEPLNQYLKNRTDISFISYSTACWRGYFGSWEIIDDKLYLIELNANIKGNIAIELSYLFPDENKVFANWFSGEIKVPQGEMLEYVHAGYGAIFEKDLILVVENGVLINEYVINNSVEYYERLMKTKKLQRKETIRKIIFPIILFMFVLIGTVISMSSLVNLDSIVANIILAIMFFEIILILVGIIYFVYESQNKMKKEYNSIAFIFVNFIIIGLIDISIGLFYLFK